MLLFAPVWVNQRRYRHRWVMLLILWQLELRTTSAAGQEQIARYQHDDAGPRKHHLLVLDRHDQDDRNTSSYPVPEGARGRTISPPKL